MNEPERKNPDISIVLPVYCEGPHLSNVLATIRQVCDSLSETYELVLVDDGSSDDTWSVIREEAARFPMLQAIQLSRNFGKEMAICAGLDHSRGRAVILMDADLQHPPSLIPEMVRIWRETGVQIVEAVKSQRGRESLLTKYGSRLFYAAMARLCGLHLEGASDFKLLDRRVVDAWKTMHERHPFFRGMTAWLGFKKAQMSFAVQDRVAGRSRWTLRALSNLAITGVVAYSSGLLRIVSITAFLFLLFALALGTETVYKKLTGVAVEGFTTVIILQLIIGACILLGLGIIGEYVARIYEETKGRPRYVVTDQIDGDR